MIHKAIKEAQLSDLVIKKVFVKIVNEAEVQIKGTKDDLKHPDARLKVLTKSHNQKLKQRATLRKNGLMSIEFKFSDFVLSEWDEMNAIIPTKRNKKSLKVSRKDPIESCMEEGLNDDNGTSFASVLNSERLIRKVNFWSFVNKEKVETYDMVIPKSVIDNVNNRGFTCSLENPNTIVCVSVILALIEEWRLLKQCSYMISMDAPSSTCVLWNIYPSTLTEVTLVLKDLLS
nr:hypothetical protein [Tanacetum cinerariifolium]